MVPNGWGFKKLSELACSSKNSFAIGPFGSDLVMSDYRNEGTPIVFVRDIKRGAFNWVSNTFVDIEKAESLKAHSVRSGDITITKMGLPPGVAAVYPKSMPDGVVTADIIRLRLDTENYDANFICLLLNSYDVSKQVKLRTAGQTRPKLTLKDYKSIGVCLPKLDEQRKIAQILSTWDRGITTTEKLIDVSKQQKKALMQQLLTGKKRLVDPETGKAFEGEWETIKIKSIFKAKTKRAKENSYTTYSVTKNGIVSQEDYFNKSVASQDTSNYKVIEFGDFVMSGLNFWMGSVDIYLNNTKGIISPAYKTFSVSDNADLKFMYHFVRSDKFNQILVDSSIVGASVVRRNFNSDVFFNWGIGLPSIREQQKITSVLTAADKDIELLEAKLAHFKQEKKALMQQLLTGKKRVNLAQTMEVTV